MVFRTTLAVLVLFGAWCVGMARAAEQGQYDGPAELPRVYVHSSLADTPAPGRTLNVKAGDNLQEALDSAKCGDTLKLQAGATFNGLFKVPAKSCDDQHWIVIETSAVESLAAAGTRVSPCYAGVASLPGRPDFHCPSPRNVMAKLVFDGKGLIGPVLFADGANHYRLVGLEITRALPEIHLRNLVQNQDEKVSSHHLVFDRLWLHGTAQDETKGGIHLSGMTFAAVVDSYFSDFHCIAGRGACTDAQAINGGGGDLPGGPWRIFNNFLEASGQSILFGGAPGSTTPADIEIRHNYLFKPMLWKPDQPDFVGASMGKPFIVKNHFELKNAQRVLFEGNVLENVWGGFTQTGFSIVLTPANQGGHCPACRVTDVTIRYNRISHAASALNIANSIGKAQAPSTAGERYSIHDLVVDDIDGQKYKGFGNFLTLISNAPPVRAIKIDHVTAFPTRALLAVINSTDRPKIENFSLTNSFLAAGDAQIIGAGGGPSNCAQRKDDPSAILKNCFADAVFNHNLILGSEGGWPPGNIVVKNDAAAGVRDWRQGHGGDYRLCREKGDAAGCKSASPGAHAASDGKAVGADIDAIESATAGVL